MPGGSVVAFDRFDERERLIVVLNNDGEPKTFTTDWGGRHWLDALSGETVVDGRTATAPGPSVILPPYGFLFLVATEGHPSYGQNPPTFA
jgi:hypothetical protein